MKTVLITGCSSGYGLETARYFHAQGWNVIATMRTPREDLLPVSERLRVLALDVTQPESIAAVLEESGPLDVLVNNAGIGLFGAFEVTPMATTREVFETNTFGVMAMTQAVLPHMRGRRCGVIVNVTSSATLAPMPLVAVYTASKMAIEGFTASLAHELEAFDVAVKLVEPGYAPTTRFTSNGSARMDGLIPRLTRRSPRPSLPPSPSRRRGPPSWTWPKGYGAPRRIPPASCVLRRERMPWPWRARLRPAAPSAAPKPPRTTAPRNRD
ncbi:hypothetical protein PHLH7_41430 [Pseudomonas sp. Ost2]|uniref:SDR family oxidoreductase n=1 Tax=Pseudomonas sp. Ost2 TaxID=2678260 RepID=UPI001BF0EE94|nr:SDR family oxidoreductase [Pseudomonas sp. Ost2]BBP78039.1 hypothetical protein PHLH7_41430 [Pseudomonas sp. Ost2]